MTVGRLPLLLLLLAGVAVLAWYDRQSREEGTSPPDRTTEAERVKGMARGDAPRTATQGADREIGRGTAAALNSNPLATLDRSMLKATVERPLFALKRRRPPPKKIVVRPPPPAPVKPPPTPPSFELLGVISNQDRTIAVLRGSDRRTIRVEQGDVVSGWRVAKITRNSIVLQHDGGVSSQIEMFRP